MKRLIASVLASACLAACGGGGTGGPSEPRLIEYYGDSTGYAVDGTTVLNGACPVAGCTIVAAPASYIRVSGYTVSNKSIGGLATFDLIDGTPLAGNVTWANRMKASKADVVLMAVGINDGYAYSPDKYRALMTQIVQIARDSGKQVVLQTPNPTREPKVTVLSATLRGLAAELGVALIDQEIGLTPLVNSKGLLAVIPDGLHPNAPTYALMGAISDQRLHEILGVGQ